MKCIKDKKHKNIIRLCKAFPIIEGEYTTCSDGYYVDGIVKVKTIKFYPYVRTNYRTRELETLYRTVIDLEVNVKFKPYSWSRFNHIINSNMPSRIRVNRSFRDMMKSIMKDYMKMFSVSQPIYDIEIGKIIPI